MLRIFSGQAGIVPWTVGLLALWVVGLLLVAALVIVGVRGASRR